MSELIKATVFRSAARTFDCRIDDAKEMVSATAKGSLLKNEESIVVGDQVLLSYSELEKEYVVEKVLPRKNELYRVLVRESKKKVTAANCDLLIILASCHKPHFKQGVVDRFLIRAHQWGIEPVVVFNKMDLYEKDKFDIKFEKDRLSFLGVNCFEISALDSSYLPKFLDKGFKELQEKLSGKTSIFLGQSGVGKSQTISALAGKEVELKTGDIGKVGKGKHTTTWSELIDCGTFQLIDSPGIRQFSLDDLPSTDLLELHPDIEERSVACKFRDCLHEKHSKGCAFHSMEDDYERKLIESRLDSYKRVKEQVDKIPDWKK